MFAFRTLMAGLTIGTACLFQLVPSQSAVAEEPIQRAFGQTLGAVFDPATSTQSSGYTDDAVFWYPDPAKIPELTEFSVSVTPITYRVYGIYATGKASDKSACIDSVHGLFAIVAKKYNGEQYGGDMRQVKGEEAYFLTQSKTHRMIHVGCEDVDGKVKLEMGYVDETIRDEAKSEGQDIAHLQADFQAQNYARILPRVQELAGKGNLWAETLLGLMYGHGYGVTRDEDAAQDYYLRAAQRGWLNAEFNLGTFYQHRFLYKQAEMWLQKAAERGLPEAEENLAQLYIAKGPLNSEEHAFHWFLRAAEDGQRESQYNTCYGYADGLGVKRDMVEAYKWCYIAARNGQKQADANKDHLAAQMRPEEVARGREAAELWLAQKHSDKQ
jgi:TPR repeat protein